MNCKVSSIFDILREAAYPPAVVTLNEVLPDVVDWVNSGSRMVLSGDDVLYVSML